MGGGEDEHHVVRSSWPVDASIRRDIEEDRVDSKVDRLVGVGTSVSSELVMVENDGCGLRGGEGGVEQKGKEGKSSVFFR